MWSIEFVAYAVRLINVQKSLDIDSLTSGIVAIKEALKGSDK